jgi:hypothetical protein
LELFSFKKRQRLPAPRVVPVAIEIISHRTGRGLHLELATQGIERTKRSAGSPNRLIGRAKLHSAGTGGKLKYSYQVITVLLP